MGLFHLANCLLLATGPYFLVYKVSGMRENDAFWKCCKMIVLYGITQLTRFFLATLVPHHLELTVQNNFLFFDVPGALIELVVVYFSVRRASSRSEFSILASSIGWATASLLSTKYIPIWFGTKGLEFDWRYICLSYQANLEMVIIFSLFYSLWIIVRRQGPVACYCVGFLIICAASLRHSIFGALEHRWSSLLEEMLVKTLLVCALGLGTLALRTVMHADKASSKMSVDASFWRDTGEAIRSTWRRYCSHADSFRGIRANGHHVPKRR
ncbi:hypothetical protein CRM22_005357 [Opisthorchis felineus]|uniref:BOS complex subunit TMEM147 n=1 Tax=Opisthorchis felineus TaxID=147828 RepID=A0A4S2LRE9_OPIFE|nr:hypothetical protein CRM22_005357 [Opisthorchis felineus]